MLTVSSASTSVVLRGATLPDGGEADVLIDGGSIVEVGHGASGDAAAEVLAHDMAGYLVVPSAVEPHAHLDKALLAEREPDPAPDLHRALDFARAAYASMDEADIRDRATRAITTAVRHGYTAIRTHVNCERGIGTRGVRVICELRDEFADVIDLQVVAMLLPPITGRAGAKHRQLLSDAITLGVDIVGGGPGFDEHPQDAVQILVAAAAEAELPVDLHLDETTDPADFTLEDFAAEVVRRGLSGRATASHCVSLGQQAPATATRVARAMADAGVGVVTLPQTNLWLQGRTEPTRIPRGLTAVRLLREAGVVVAGGGDNWRDPFNPLGRIDPMETAELLVAAAHLPPAEAYCAISSDARRVMGLPPVALQAGSQADLLGIRADTISDAIASGSSDRWVFRAGRLVARTRTVHDVDPAERFIQRERGRSQAFTSPNTMAEDRT